MAVSVLVAMAFHGPKPPDKHHCAHDDGNPANNRPGNLFWKTRKENEADKVRHGTKIEGSRHPLAKLAEANIPVIRDMMASGVALMDIAALYGVSKGKIGHIKSGLSWKHV